MQYLADTWKNMRKIAIYGIIIFQVILIGSLVKGIQTSYKSRERVGDLEKRKNELVAENSKMKVEKEYVQSDYYLEKVAREDLHLVKPGETVVIVPEDSNMREKPAEAKAMAGEGKKQNWEKWWELLVK